MSLSYINKQGKEVLVTITEHAKRRFIERYNLINITHEGLVRKNKEKITRDNALEKIENLFKRSSRLQNLNDQHKRRLKKHGKDTLYFKTGFFTFVVQHSEIITIEISNKDLKFLNKPRSNLLS